MVRTLFMTLDYQINRRLSVQAIAPIRMVEAPKDFHPGDRRLRSFKGLSDIIALATVKLNLPKSARSPQFSFIGGLRLPTGNAEPDHEFSGELSRDPVLQAGHGTFDPIGGFRYVQSFPKFTLSADALGRVTGGRNEYGYRYANEVQAGVSVSKAVPTPGFLKKAVDVLAVGARLHGVLSGHDEDRGVRVSNTGGQWLFVIPSISLTTRHGTSYFMQLQVPLHQRVSGGQLVSNYAFTTGVSFDLTRPRRVEVSSGTAEKPAAVLVSQAPVISRGEEVDLKAHVVAGTVTVFEFYADWCHVCRSIEPALGGLIADTGAALRRINIGNGRTDVTRQYGVTATPTFHIYKASGELSSILTTGDVKLVREAIEKASGR